MPRVPLLILVAGFFIWLFEYLYNQVIKFCNWFMKEGFVSRSREIYITGKGKLNTVV